MATRRPRNPLKTPTSASESHRTNALLEELRKEFRTFGEGLSAMRGELGSVKAAVRELDADIRLIKPIVQTLAPVRDELRSMADVLRSQAKDIDLLKYTTSKTSQELEAIKTELRLIRSDLSTYAKRLEAVETKLA